MRYPQRFGVLVGLFALVTASVSAAEPAAEGVPTFSKDVAPILFGNCVVCHRPGEVAPMSLLSYNDARPWSRAIKEKVVMREMPPWHADPRYGDFRNDPALSQAEIDTIVAWADGGAPRGDDADLPSVPEFSKGWAAAVDPDYVLELPVEYQVPAEGEVEYLNWYSAIPFEKDFFFDAIEMRPGNRAVVHHSGAFLVELPEATQLVEGIPYNPDGTPLTKQDMERGGVTPNSSKLVSFVPGRGYEAYRGSTAKRLPAGGFIEWVMHYNSTGRPETDRSRLGFWEKKGPFTHEVINSLGGLGPSSYVVDDQELRTSDRGSGRDLPVIPPHVSDWGVTSITAIWNDVTILGVTPHFHLRGKAMTYVLTYPTGDSEVLLHVPKYDFNWQHYYDLAEPKRVPAGSKLTIITTFDNSIRNRYNPAPNKEVYWGEQSWDEMYNPQVRITVDKYDLTKTQRDKTQEN